ncbi:MAG: flagellar biosynthesis anti-sigma factor FlgM [Anaerotignum sp.]
MKINLNSYLNLQATTKSKDKVTQSTTQTISVPRNISRDEIIISSKIENADQSAFMKELNNTISKEVTTPCTEEKISDLKQQIEVGTYQIDIDQIAKKMLLG